MRVKFALCFVASAMLVLPAFGQTFGEISGLITDTTGAVMPGVTITVTNPQTNFTRTVASNESGYYNFPALLPGLYNVLQFSLKLVF
jgi:Carboxypeptidase regulatory-like domain